jgi:hypothetical protein
MLHPTVGPYQHRRSELLDHPHQCSLRRTLTFQQSSPQKVRHSRLRTQIILARITVGSSPGRVREGLVQSRGTGQLGPEMGQEAVEVIGKPPLDGGQVAFAVLVWCGKSIQPISSTCPVENRTSNPGLLTTRHHHYVNSTLRIDIPHDTGSRPKRRIPASVG